MRNRHHRGLRHPLSWPLAITLSALAACASPDPRLYTIAATAGAAQAGGAKVIVVRPIALARFLDRPQIVRSSETYRLQVMANDWWGEPLGAMLTRVLVEELGRRLKGSAVYAETGAISANPDATVELNVERLDENAAGQLMLVAQAAVTFETRRRAPITAAISAAVSQLADGLATMLHGRRHARASRSPGRCFASVTAAV